MEFHEEKSNDVLQYFTIEKTTDDEENSGESQYFSFFNEDEACIEVLETQSLGISDDNIDGNQQVVLESDFKLYQLEDGRLFVEVETPNKLSSTLKTDPVPKSEISNLLVQESRTPRKSKNTHVQKSAVNVILLTEEEKFNLLGQKEDAGNLPEVQNKFKCLYPDCHGLFSTFHESTVHMKAHSVEIKPYTCTVEGCDKRFATNYSRKTHIRTHTGEKPYACKECEKTFKTSGDLRKHSRLHTGEKPYKCPVVGCGKSFRTTNIRKVHLRSHTGERPYVCDYPNCGKAFSSSTNFKNHSRIHSGEKPFACSVPGCDKRFTEYSSLYKHSVVHQVDRPFECSFCQQNFKSESALNLHKRVKHNVIISPDGVEIVVQME